MKSSELDKILQSARVPEPAPEFWEGLPLQVQRGINRGDLAGEAREAVGTWSPLQIILRRALPGVLAALCLAVGFFWGANSRPEAAVQLSELAEARACWREVAALFPNQLQAIVFGQQGNRVILAEKDNQPVSAPIYLKLCDGKNCQRFITFSGQQIKVNGESFEVLMDRQGEILLVGEAAVWNGAKQSGLLGSYRVFAQPLAKT